MKLNDIKIEEVYNPLHIITFHNKEDMKWLIQSILILILNMQ